MVIRLTYPNKSHETEDLRPLYEEFKQSNPETFDLWYRIESKGKIDSPEELKGVHKEVREFLKARTEWESNAALTGAFADFRRLINRDKFSH